MKGSITKDYSAYKLTTNASVQDLAFVFGEGVADEKYVSLKVSWIEQATIEIVKKDDTADVNLAGAVFGVYSDEACTCLLYTSDQAIREAELYYTQLEANLQERINNMESDEPGHEEYRYNIGPIEHDPFILISYLSAKYEEFTFPCQT